MNNLGNLLQLATLNQLRDQNKTLPKLGRTFKKRQIIEIIIGALTIWIYGLGVIFWIGALLDLYVFSNVYKVVNSTNKETFFMTKSEWKKYKALKKTMNNRVITADDIINEKKTDKN